MFESGVKENTESTQNNGINDITAEEVKEKKVSFGRNKSIVREYERQRTQISSGDESDEESVSGSETDASEDEFDSDSEDDYLSVGTEKLAILGFGIVLGFFAYKYWSSEPSIESIEY